MRIEISIENNKWLRADLVDNGKRVGNLYHRVKMSDEPLLQAYQTASAYVTQNYPQHRNLEMISDIGAASECWGFN